MLSDHYRKTPGRSPARARTATSLASTRGHGGGSYGATGVYVRGECGEDGWVQQNTGNYLDGGITEDGKWQAMWEKLLCLPTQCYNVPYGKFGRNFVVTLSVELDGIQTRKWKSERVIIFQLVILQRAQAVNNAKHISTCIQFQLDCWGCGAFEKLMKYTHNVATGFLGKYHGIQSEEQCHYMFSNLFLKSKFYKAVIFDCAQETGGVVWILKFGEDRIILFCSVKTFVD